MNWLEELPWLTKTDVLVGMISIGSLLLYGIIYLIKKFIRRIR